MTETVPIIQYTLNGKLRVSTLYQSVPKCGS